MYLHIFGWCDKNKKTKQKGKGKIEIKISTLYEGLYVRRSRPSG